MRRVKSIIYSAGLILMILSAAMGYVAFKNMGEMRSADSYEDEGVHSFSPYEVLPVQVRNTGPNARTNPTKTVYKVYYQATDGSGYKWSDEAPARSLGQKIVDEKVPVERRVLSIPESGTYITVEPAQNAESYTAGLQRRYTVILALSAGYLVLYVIIWCVIGIVNKVRTERAREWS